MALKWDYWKLPTAWRPRRHHKIRCSDRLTRDSFGAGSLEPAGSRVLSRVSAAQKGGEVAISSVPVKLIALLIATTAFAQAPSKFQPGVKPFLAYDDPVIVLTHVRVIDGTGAAAREDQTIVIDHGKIASVGGAVPASARTIDLTGHT